MNIKEIILLTQVQVVMKVLTYLKIENIFQVKQEIFLLLIGLKVKPRFAKIKAATDLSYNVGDLMSGNGKCFNSKFSSSPQNQWD